MREIVGLEIITILLTIVLALWAVAKLLYPIKFADFTAALNITRYLKVHGKEEQKFSLFNVFISLGTMLCFTILIHFFLSSQLKTIALTWSWMAILGLAIVGYFILKQALEKIIGTVFEMGNLIDSLIFIRTTYRNYAGAIAFIASVFLAYGWSGSNWIIYLALILIAFVFLFGNYTFYKSNEKLILGNFFYFILYLCALEIGPLIIVYHTLRVLG